MFNNRIIGVMRKKTIRILSALVLILNITCKIEAQSIQNVNMDKDTISIDKRIPNLDAFIQSAQQNSPLLKISDIELEGIFEKIKLEKKSWSDFIFIEGMSRYGQYSQLILNESTTNSSDVTGIKSANQQLTYYGGVTLKLPISYFLDKKNRLKVFDNNLNEAKYRKEQIAIELKRLVIEEYYKLLNSFQIMQVNMGVVQSLKISYLKAQKDIANGLIDLNDFSNIVISKGKAEEGYYNAKSLYFSQYDRIQALTGLNLNTSK